MFGRDRASFPWVGTPCAAIINQTEALSFGIFEVEGKASVTLGNSAMTHIVAPKAAPPPFEGAFSRYPQPGSDNAMGASLLRRGRPNEEGQVGSWTPLPVRVKKMVGSDIVLIDGFLYQTHPEEVRVETVITARVRRNRCEMVDTVKLHGAAYTIRSGLPMFAIEEYRGRFPVATRSCRRRR